ncbi:hypothetical protein GOV08_01500 [Candidatus Woesearchaeota archaeon]|nr:hypothetical protein [Candidatus Woesearchaeota archaeon]
MEKVITDDGSVTFRNKEVDECYHTKSGAVTEAKEKFAKPSNLKDGMKILDFCFGLGYNSAAAIEKLNRVEIVGLENDKIILEEIQRLSPDFKKYDMIKQAAKNRGYDDRKIKINIVLGNAKKTIKDFKEEFDAVFFDPFSPKKQPEMWTKEVFSDIFKTMKKGGVLTTYSCASFVRKNMKAAGFEVSDGPTIGRRSPSTIGVNK